MKILIVSNSPWRNENSFGNSFSNIFEGIPDLEIANVYCKYGTPKNNCVSRYYQITEKTLINNLLGKGKSGQEVFMPENEETPKLDSGEKIFNKAKKHKSIPMFWARAFIWKIGRWCSPELVEFVDSFKPDLLFIPIYYSHYLHDINEFILKRFNIPAIGYVLDDVYTLKQFSLSPLFWIDKFILRPRIKQVFSWCKKIYVISETQKREYTKIFGDKFEVLTKCSDFDDSKRPEFKTPGDTLKMIYAGNVSKGRYKILSELAKAVEALNSDGKRFMLDIYTSTPLSDKQKSRLSIDGCCALHPPVSYGEIRKLQAQADILVHAEAFDLKERLATHQSFSTKIVDYLATNRCILAIGDKSCASIDYFVRNSCGAVALSKDEITVQLEKLYSDKYLLKYYADKAWASGKKNHQRSKMQKALYEEIKKTVGSKNEGITY